MPFLFERLAHFIRWFFNASPTALIESPVASGADRQRAHARPRRPSR